jgi:predicted enzyme related to lactoylglutathione lyase
MGRLGDSFIVLQAHIEPEIKSAILFAVDNLDTITEAIKQQGGNIQNSRYSGAFGEAVMLTDPDGLPLEFITPSPELNEF